MNDAAEVLSAIYENLETVAGGATLVRELFEWQVGTPPPPPFPRTLPCLLSTLYQEAAVRC